jgi:predicted amidohydrolase YtcJ
VVPGSSDRPVVNGAPLLGMHDMVNQRTSSGASFNPDEALTGLEALRAYTMGSAYASHQESVKGSLTPGKLADLVVLDGNPATVDPARIKDIAVLRTMIGGVFR